MESVDGAPAEVSRKDFPDDFIFGVATAAFQVEGGRKEDNAGPCIWDAFCETEGNILDGSNGDTAVDQYHRYKEDVDLISNLGFGAYRFSIAWTRIFPDGLGTKVNEKGIAYYNNLIDSLLEKGIQPFVTLYHWDLPNYIHENEGGWLTSKIVNYFAIYAETCFAYFGDRVKHWATLNEPLQTAVNGYFTGIFAPGRKENPSIEPYLAAHYQILAHGAAVAVYRDKFKDKQGGQIGLVVDCEWADPFSDDAQDKIAAQRRIDFQLGWFLDPIFHGEYPASMRERLGEQLPRFTDEEKKLIHHSVDFIGINCYTMRLISHVDGYHGTEDYYRIQQIDRKEVWPDGNALGIRAASEWLFVIPLAIRKLLNHVSTRYPSTPIYVTENGMDDEDNVAVPLNELLDDKLRVQFYKGYLSEVAQSIRDGADVRGYFAWSLLDNFEWAQGYTKRFGIVYVDYKNGLTRHPKSSAHWFSQFLKGTEGKNVDG